MMQGTRITATRLVYTTTLLILVFPRLSHYRKQEQQPRNNPGEMAMPSLMGMMMGAEGVITSGHDEDHDFHPPGPAFKEWRLNTNFDNVRNWKGLAGHENCSQNIYSFPSWYNEEYVMTLPKTFVGKQIILPVNGHFVFQEGIHTFFAGSDEASSTCEGLEVDFIRNSRADWYDPANWLHHHHNNLKGVDWGESRDSLLNVKGAESSSSSQSEISAIPHVERVPCQYDSAWFPGNSSSFNLKISSNVTIARFYHGDKKLTYPDVAILMNSPLGKLQFQKAPETIFSITDDDSRGNRNDASRKPVESLCEGKDAAADSDRCICSNYLQKQIKSKICSLAKCDEDIEENCQSPITPHGFCCPVCGYHLRIRHTGNLKLLPIYSKLKSQVSKAGFPAGTISAYITRYKEKGAHLILLPRKNPLKDLTLLRKLKDLLGKIEPLLKQEREVVEVTLTESWGGAAGDGGGSDRLEGSGLGGGLITLIVFLVLVVILGGIALFIFMWNKKHGYPSLTLSSMTSALPRMSSMRIPIVPGVSGGGGGGRRSSTLSNSLHSFGFARFTNERMSSVTISPGESSEGSLGGGGGSSKQGKSSSIRRADKVDDEPLPMMTEEEKVTDANSGAFGFTNVSYDLVAGEESAEITNKNEQQHKMEGEKDNKTEKKYPILTIPEVTIVEVDDTASSDSLKMAVPPPKPPKRSQQSSNADASSGKGEEKGKPGFVASRFTKTYKKLGDDLDDVDVEESKPGAGAATTVPLKKTTKKNKGKKNEKSFKANRLEEEDVTDEDDAKPVVSDQIEAEGNVFGTLSTVTTDTGEVSSSMHQEHPQQKEESGEAELVNLE